MKTRDHDRIVQESYTSADGRNHSFGGKIYSKIRKHKRVSPRMLLRSARKYIRMLKEKGE